jgi:hypothetical protein
MYAKTLLTALLALACPLAPAQAVADSTERPDAGPESEAGFEFHSGFWMNLHHFLYQQARLRGQADESLPPPRGGSPDRPADLGTLSATERTVWIAALDHYARSLAKHDLLFGQGMIDVKDRLAAAEGKPSLEGAGLDPALRTALEQAAPVYRARWWAEHDRANRAWIRSARPLLERYAPKLSERVAAAFRAPWPPAPIRVDVTTYANWSGAYTTVAPLHVTVSSQGAGNQGDAALEMLFHEPSHAIVSSRNGPVAAALGRAFGARGKPVPRDLWHAILFFTTGELTRRALEEAGVRGYAPYAYKNGLYARSPEWDAFRRALEANWLPYLDGKVDFETAVGRVADSLAAEAPPSGR